MASFPNTAVLSCVFFLIMFCRADGTNSNILLTGQTLRWNEKLSYKDNDVHLVLQFNCNLELKNGFQNRLWDSNSSCLNCFPCSLSLTNRGQLLILDRDGEQRWASPHIKSIGKYVGILHPSGEFTIYGPGIWFVGPDIVSVNFNNSEKESSKNNLKNGPTIYNVLLPKEELHDGDKLSNSVYEFIFKDCELILKVNGEIGWNSDTYRTGDNCLATLDDIGALSITTGDDSLIWISGPLGNEGDYVLVMQQNGNVVIYGPKVWSTKDSKSGFIKMAAVEK